MLITMHAISACVQMAPGNMSMQTSCERTSCSAWITLSMYLYYTCAAIALQLRCNCGGRLISAHKAAQTVVLAEGANAHLVCCRQSFNNLPRKPGKQTALTSSFCCLQRLHNEKLPGHHACRVRT